MSDTDPFFDRDGQTYRPTPIARGPWDPGQMHGRVLAGLMAREVETLFGDPAFHYARMTIDLFRPPPLAPVDVSARMVRDGNRIKVADASIDCGGVEIARSSVVMLRKADQPPGNVWSPPPWDVPLPDDIAPPPQRPRGDGWAPMWDTRSISPGGFGSVEQKRCWIRENRPLVAGEALSPFVRAALAADYTNPFANSGDAGLNFVNADITLYLHRLPVEEWVGFEVVAHNSAEGVAVGECALYDVKGPVGRSTVCGVANQRRR